jgi:hypothetical protein
MGSSNYFAIINKPYPAYFYHQKGVSGWGILSAFVENSSEKTEGKI